LLLHVLKGTKAVPSRDGREEEQKRAKLALSISFIDTNPFRRAELLLLNHFSKDSRLLINKPWGLSFDP
jgi:hypothetical protein